VGETKEKLQSTKQVIWPEFRQATFIMQIRCVTSDVTSSSLIENL